jgi:ferredoxin-NADP reductase
MTEFSGDLLITDRTAVADGVVQLVLRDPGGRPLPAWTPGAHLDLVFSNGMTRQYSLCGRVSDRSGYTVAVLRDAAGRGASRHVHDVLAAGDLVRVTGPRNHFPLLPASRYEFIAGGIGITPLLPMLAAAEAAGTPWRLLYGGRTRASMAYADELSARGDHVEVCPQDETGLLDLASALAAPQAGTAVYGCGPEPLLTAIERLCATWPPGSLHVERFQPKQSAPQPEAAFEIELKQSGRTLAVPADRSVLEVVEQAGAAPMSSCAEGTCGTCETRVIEGRPDHRDSVLSEEERAAGASMMICVSRSLDDRLVLDL